MSPRLVRHAILTAPRTLDLVPVEVPRLGSGEVRIAITQCGICGSDVHQWRRDDPPLLPLMLGSEFAGRVVDVGGDVLRLHRGDTVAVWVPTDRRLGAMPGRGPRLGLGDEAVVDAPYCLPVAGHVRFPFAAQPLGRVLTTIERAGAGSATHTVVIGAGFKALLAAMLLEGRSRHGSVVVTSGRPGLTGLARQAGIDVVNPQHLFPLLRHLTRGRGPDLVLDFTGTQGGMEFGAHLARPGGTFVFGSHQLASRSIPTMEMRDRGVTLIEADEPDESTMLRGMASAVELLNRGAVDPGRIIRRICQLELTPMAFEEAADGVGRVVVVP